jgi:septum formation protein
MRIPRKGCSSLTAAVVVVVGITSFSCDAMRPSLFGHQWGKEFQVILASASPRRLEILSMAGVENIQVLPSNFEEDLPHTEPATYAAATAAEKARQVAAQEFQGHSTPRMLVIGADTIVALDDGTILEKPDGREGAKKMLRALSGEWHSVHSGVALFSSKQGINNPVVSFSEMTRVKFVPLTDQDIEAYIDTGEPMDKAGAYGIQGMGGQMVEKIDGCFFNVAGLPLSRLSCTISRLLAEGSI